MRKAKTALAIAFSAVTFLAVPISVYSFQQYIFHWRISNFSAKVFLPPNVFYARKTQDIFYRPARPIRPIQNILRATPTPSQAVVSLVTPTQVPTPTPTPTPTSIPPQSTPVQVLSSQEDPKIFIMNAINAYRAQFNLSPVKTDSYTCDFAKIRAQEISTNFNHDGFNNRINSNTLPYPSYKYVNENIAMTSDYKEVVKLWENSPGHAENMRADTTYVCVEASGNYYAYEGWKP